MGHVFLSWPSHNARSPERKPVMLEEALSRKHDRALDVRVRREKAGSQSPSAPKFLGPVDAQLECQLPHDARAALRGVRGDDSRGAEVHEPTDQRKQAFVEALFGREGERHQMML